jgi:hypothetical protein
VCGFGKFMGVIWCISVSFSCLGAVLVTFRGLLMWFGHFWELWCSNRQRFHVIGVFEGREYPCGFQKLETESLLPLGEKWNEGIPKKNRHSENVLGRRLRPFTWGGRPGTGHLW